MRPAALLEDTRHRSAVAKHDIHSLTVGLIRNDHGSDSCPIFFDSSLHVGFLDVLTDFFQTSRNRLLDVIRGFVPFQ